MTDPDMTATTKIATELPDAYQAPGPHARRRYYKIAHADGVLTWVVTGGSSRLFLILADLDMESVNLAITELTERQAAQTKVRASDDAPGVNTLADAPMGSVFSTEGCEVPPLGPEFDADLSRVQAELKAATAAARATEATDERAKLEATLGRLAARQRQPDLVAEFIDGHAKRLADASDSDLPWDLLEGEHRTAWSAQVHDMLNHLRVIDNPDGNPEIMDGRAGGSYDRYLAERAQVRELTEEVRQLTEAHNERLDGLEAAAMQPERVPGLTVQANPGPGRYVKGQDTKVTLVGDDGRALVLPTRKVTIVIDGRGLAIATIEAPVARLDLRGLKPQRKQLPDDPAATCDLLGLVGVDLPPATVAAWTPEQRALADAWAGAVHLHASDHDDVVLPPRPDFLPAVVP